MSEILYPIFLICGSIDTPLKDLFLGLSCGICPKYVTLNSKILAYRGTEIEYSHTDPYGLIKNVRELLSPLIKCDVSPKFIWSDDNDRWASVRKQHTRDVLITNYVIKRGRELKLTTEQKQRSIQVIKIAIRCRDILNTDIVYSKGRIHDIINFNFNTFKVTPNCKPANKPTVNKNKYLMSHQWKLYLNRAKKNPFNIEISDNDSDYRITGLFN